MSNMADNPEKDPQARGDPYRTLFVTRLSYDVKEADLEREFSRFGPIERVRRSTLLDAEGSFANTSHSDPHRQGYSNRERLEKTSQRLCVHRL